MIRTYRFYETGSIPGIPGEFHTGQIVDIDTDTNTVVDTRMMEGVSIDDEEEEPTSKVLKLPRPEESRKPSIFDVSPSTSKTSEPTQEGG